MESAILRVRRSKQVYRSRISFWTGRQQSPRFGAVPPPGWPLNRFVSGETGAACPRGCRPSTRAEMVLSPCWRLAFSGHSRSGQAHTPNFDRLWGNCPNALLQASGKDVGLPPGQMALFPCCSDSPSHSTKQELAT